MFFADIGSRAFEKHTQQTDRHSTCARILLGYRVRSSVIVQKVEKFKKQYLDLFTEMQKISHTIRLVQKVEQLKKKAGDLRIQLCESTRTPINKIMSVDANPTSSFPHSAGT